MSGSAPPDGGGGGGGGVGGVGLKWPCLLFCEASSLKTAVKVVRSPGPQFFSLGPHFQIRGAGPDPACPFHIDTVFQFHKRW